MITRSTQNTVPIVNEAEGPDMIDLMSCSLSGVRQRTVEVEDCCIELATRSDYIHNQMSEQVTQSHVRI